MTIRTTASSVARDLDRGPSCSKRLDVAELREVYAQMTGPSAGQSVPPITAVADRGQGIHRGGLLSASWDPASALDERQCLLASLYCAVSVVGRYVIDRGIHMPQLDTLTYPQMLALNEAVVPFYVVGGRPGRQGFAGYHFPLEPGVLTALFQGARPAVAREILRRIAISRDLGAPMSAEAEQIISLILYGAIRFPDMPPERKAVTEHWNTLLGAIADRLHDLVGYDAAAARATLFRCEYPPICGCTIASAAMHAFDVAIPSDMGRKTTNDDRPKRADGIPDPQDLLRPAPISFPETGPEGYETRILAAIDCLNTRLKVVDTRRRSGNFGVRAAG